MKNFHLTIFLFLIIFSAASCSTSKQSQVLTPTVTRILPPLPESRILIPVKVYMKPLLVYMDSSTAKEFTSERWPDFYQSSCDFRYKYRFIRSPFTFSCVNNVVNIGFRGYYQIGGSKTLCTFGKQVAPWVTGSCGFNGEPLRRVDLNITSQLQFLTNHQIRTTTRLGAIKPIDKCEVSLMKQDITQQIMDSIRTSIETYGASFDQFVQDLNNNAMLTDWRQGSKVLPIVDYGFLNINPVMLNVGTFNYSKDTLSFSVGFRGKPAFSSDSLSLVKSAPAPAITTTNAPGLVDTYLDAVYDYSAFNKLLNDSLQNKPFTVEGKTFVIKNVTLGGTDEGKISVDLSFTGYKTGTLHLSGTPVIDTANQVLSMPDINFSLDSKDMLLNMAKGLFRKRIMKELKNQSVLDLAALIENNKDKIASRLNQQVNDWMSTTGRLDKLEIVGILSSSKKLHLQLHVVGNITMIANPPVSILQ
jgi:hypothetical protein